MDRSFSLREKCYWILGALLLFVVPLLYLVGSEDIPVFEDEAAFRATFAALESGPLHAEGASVGESPRNEYTLLFPPGQYEIQTTNSSILTLTGHSGAVKKRKERWYRLVVSDADSAGRSTYRLKLIRIRHNKQNQNVKHVDDIFYDTDIASSLRGNPMMQGLMSKLVQTETRGVVDSNGLVIETESDEPEDLFSGLDPGIDAMLKRLNESGMGFGEIIFPQRSFLPMEPVGQGAVWYLHGSDDLGLIRTNHESRCRFRTELEFEFYRVASHDLSAASLGVPQAGTFDMLLQESLLSGSKTDLNIHGVITFMPNGGLKRMVSLEKSLMEGAPEAIVLREKSTTVTQLLETHNEVGRGIPK